MDAALARFSKNVTAGPGGCLVWTGTINTTGYGTFHLNGQKYRTHKWLWEYFNGPVPSGKELAHKCHNRACVSLAHVRPLTHKENCHETRLPERCPKGHEPEEFMARKNRWGGPTRVCRACARGSSKEHYRKKVGLVGPWPPDRCPRGHDPSEFTTYGRGRICLACKREKERERRNSRPVVNAVE